MTQTQLSEDSARFSISASSELEIQPAAGEFDSVSWQAENASILLQYFLDDGTNNTAALGSSIITTTDERLGQHLNFATNTIFTVFNNATAGTETFQRSIMTKSQE